MLAQLVEGISKEGESAWGCGCSDPEVPTELALRTVIGARLALAHRGSGRGDIGLGFVDASLVSRGVGDAVTGVVGVCLCWWNAEGCQCYQRCRRRAHQGVLH